jgi:hypothetical protein
MGGQAIPPFLTFLETSVTNKAVSLLKTAIKARSLFTTANKAGSLLKQPGLASRKNGDARQRLGMT